MKNNRASRSISVIGVAAARMAAEKRGIRHGDSIAIAHQNIETVLRQAA